MHRAVSSLSDDSLARTANVFIRAVTRLAVGAMRLAPVAAALAQRPALRSRSETRWAVPMNEEALPMHGAGKGNASPPQIVPLRRRLALTLAILALLTMGHPGVANADDGPGQQFYSTLTCQSGWTVRIYSRAENWVEYSWKQGGYASSWNPYGNYWEVNTWHGSTWAVVEWDHHRVYSGRTCKPVI